MSCYLDSHPFIRHVVADKIRGAMVGSALGDAIGLYTEFLNNSMSKDAYPEGRFTLTGSVTPFCRDSHRNKFTEGSWTDDTDHALLILLSYLHHDGTTLSSFDFAKRLRIWIEQGLLCLNRLPLGLGQTVGSIVTSSNYLNDPKAEAYRNWMNSNFNAAPNGSLMRTHPLGLMSLQKSMTETFEIATDFSLVTHADPRCVVSCCIATAIIRGILRGELQSEDHIDQLVDEAASFVESRRPHIATNASKEQIPTSKPPPPFDRDELYTHTRATSYPALQIDDLRKQGYVYKCLGSSTLCLRLAMRRLQPTRQPNNTALLNSHIFEDLITELVMEGGDADTNATVAGAFLGCLLGFSSLPSHWVEGLQDVQWLLRKSDDLIQVLGVDECAVGYVGSADADTNEDGGRGMLDRVQLETREKAFMEIYLHKTVVKKGGDGIGSGLSKKWKGVFG